MFRKTVLQCVNIRYVFSCREVNFLTSWNGEELHLKKL